ncbi:peptide ABC transporter permease [Megamonas hypermegale]|uniref:Oligopeptide transport system permease protein oppB n=1 Tax=Megamonas hypermegale TaxID=158847 RepID=A0A239TEC4_9FIRM|nr:ABC transporter permease [Megamonas hypermegale]MBM6761137.1 ABC transporter permease [Megamonas hypermegale]MBM6833076.1 ABC transporter permease [Megamonas hypermegale]OUO41165.1 peptide ABC transporter permease [Megamonas hypermegale]SNU96060.1 Oligopeptide transport system permease protein oppB [Megamonas hypermegale]HJG07621.1 ABC transporter permease [Megamonas hypermegale]
MLAYIIKRIFNAVIVLWVVTTITFFLMHAIPGGPFTVEKSLPPIVQQSIEERYKLNDPLYKQYSDYLTNLIQGDLGPSFKYPGRSVNDIIKDGFPVSFQLGMEAVLIAIIIGIPAGIIAAINQGKWQDHAVNFFTTLGVAVPSFVVAALLIYVLSTKLHLLPSAMWEGWQYQIMPALALSGMPTSFIARLTRSSMLDVLGQDYIKTARAKGLSRFTVLFKHALPNSLIPVVTYAGPMTAGILTGSFVIENIFAIPGLGQYFVTSIYNRDYTVILGVTIFYSIIIIVLNMIVDLIYPFLDPRIKLGGGKGE